MTVLEQNANQIREPFAVTVSMTGLTEDELTYAETGTPKVEDELANTYGMRSLMDFAGDGFPLDGSCVPYNSEVEESEDDGKLGYRTNIGEGVTVTVTATTAFNSLAINATGCTITYNGVTYTGIGGIFTISVGARTAVLTFNNLSADDRIRIQYIRAGISLAFDNENLTSVVLALRSDLTRINPTWQVSEIEINAYWPDDIQMAVANISDDIPIIYSAGYTGDMSPVRYFYLQEASVERNLVTLKGVDASFRMTEALLTPAYTEINDSKVYRSLYSRLATTITDAGIKLLSRQSAPPAYVSDQNYEPYYVAGIARAQYVANALALWHTDNGVGFYPVFVDAGRPTLRWSKPTSKWTIYEEDCTDIVKNYDQVIAQVKVPNMYVYCDTERSLIEEKEVRRNRIYTVSLSTPYTSFTVTNATILESCPAYIRFRATATGVSRIRGKRIRFYDENENERPHYTTVKANRTGIKKLVDMEQYSGQVEQVIDGIGYPLIENGARHAMNESEKRGSFHWKGNPMMQPRDVFTFAHLDGTSEICTIETIELTHDGGGTSANITYRVGVV